MMYLPKRIDLIRAQPDKSVGAEIGVWRGYFSSEILRFTDTSMLYLVDPWAPSHCYTDPLQSTNHESDLKETQSNIRGFVGRWHIVRKTSQEAAVSEEVPLLDWAYIDANHAYQDVMKDLIAWSKKLKPEGRILGHDYTNSPSSQHWSFGVVDAVNDFCKNQNWKLTHLTIEEWPSYQLVRQ